MKYRRLFLLAFILFIYNSVTYAQCFENVTYEVILEKKGIELQFKQSYDQVEVNLENVWLSGNNQFENTVNINNVVAGTKYLVFENLLPSKYIIQLTSDDCKYIVGGLEGIILKGEDEK